LLATPFSTDRIGLTWSAAPSGGLPIQNYLLYRGTVSSNLTKLAIVAQASYADTSVNFGQTYYYAVQAADTKGDLSPMSATVPATLVRALSAPTGLLTTPVSTTNINLT
jgi:fibronectin type 3 domain-containing protein